MSTSKCTTLMVLSCGSHGYAYVLFLCVNNALCPQVLTFLTLYGSAYKQEALLSEQICQREKNVEELKVQIQEIRSVLLRFSKSITKVGIFAQMVDRIEAGRRSVVD